jgi:tRNA pseudouridine55 synthase
LEPRDIHIDAFEITSFDFPVLGFKLVCSTGTYVRSLAHDFGVALGCGAHLSLLRRTAIGDFSVDDARNVDEWLNEIQSSDKGNKEELGNNQNA